MSEDIYRIISFPSFVNLLTMKQERFVHPLQWEDTHEGMYYTILNRPEKCRDFLKKIYTNFTNHSQAILNFFKVLIFPAFTYAQCWSTVSESDALWRIYSYDKMSVQIHTTVEQLREVISSSIQEQVIIKDVKYDLKGSIDDMFNDMLNILLNNNDISEPFFHKRPAFKHEKEKRVLIYKHANAEIPQRLYKILIEDNIRKQKINPDDVTIDDLVFIINSFFSTNKNFKYDVNQSHIIPITDSFKYIKTVKLNPFAPDWIDKLVAKLCSNNGLNYVGRSKLYEKV